MDYRIITKGADILLQTAGQNANPFLVQNHDKSVFVLNSHTFSQKDFDEAGEHLLCPSQIGLLELPESWVNTIRISFYSKGEPVIDAPSRVTYQHLTDDSFIIHNYNQGNILIHIMLPEPGDYYDGFTGKKISTGRNNIEMDMLPRTRIWIKSSK
jgi:hypothetical protein